MPAALGRRCEAARGARAEDAAGAGGRAVGADGRTRESAEVGASAGGCAGGCGGGGGGGGSSSSSSSGSSGSGDDERVLALPLLAAASIATQLLARLLGRPSKASPPSLIDMPPMPAITAALAASRGDGRSQLRSQRHRKAGLELPLRRRG